MGAASVIPAALLGLALLAAGAAEARSPLEPGRWTMAQVNEPGCPPGGFGIALCPRFGEKSELEAAREPGAVPPPQYDSRNDCLKAGWGITQCRGFEEWWKKGESVEMPPNPDQHQGCGGFGVTECPPGGGAGGRHRQEMGENK